MPLRDFIRSDVRDACRGYITDCREYQYDISIDIFESNITSTIVEVVVR